MYFNLYSTQTEQKIFDCINESILNMGFVITSMHFHRGKKFNTLELSIDHSFSQNKEDQYIIMKDNTKYYKSQVNIDECALISESVKQLIYVNDIVSDCNINVTSPGINKNLCSIQEIQRHINCPISVKLHSEFISEVVKKIETIDIKNQFHTTKRTNIYKLQESSKLLKCFLLYEAHENHFNIIDINLLQFLLKNNLLQNVNDSLLNIEYSMINKIYLDYDHIDIFEIAKLSNK